MSTATLAERQSDLTRQLILAAALDTLERGSLADLTVRAVAKRANLAERTVFRYFADREQFLDAVAAGLSEKLRLPSPPASLEELHAAPRALYERFEDQSKLTRAALHTDLFHRMRAMHARPRTAAVRKLLDELAPRRTERERRIATANIRHYLQASTWHYYRFYFDFSLEDTIAAAETAIRDTLVGLKSGAAK
jgi:AcrR family transcriptional regulator